MVKNVRMFTVYTNDPFMIIYRILNNKICTHVEISKANTLFDMIFDFDQTRQHTNAVFIHFHKPSYSQKTSKLTRNRQTNTQQRIILLFGCLKLRICYEIMLREGKIQVNIIKLLCFYIKRTFKLHLTFLFNFTVDSLDVFGSLIIH